MLHNFLISLQILLVIIKVLQKKQRKRSYLKCCYLLNCQILALLFQGRQYGTLNRLLNHLVEVKTEFQTHFGTQSLQLCMYFDIGRKQYQHHNYPKILTLTKASRHICPAVALYIQLLFNCPHMHITYFTDVHKSDQVKGLSWAITENIFCRVENLSITFFYKGWRDDCVLYTYQCNQLL